MVELLYGVSLALPGKLLDTAEPPATSFLENLRRSPVSLPIRPQSGPPPELVSPQAFSLADFVFIRRRAPGLPLSPLYDGPYRVLQYLAALTLELGCRQEHVTVDRLKPCLATEVVPAVPPLRGRPPKTSST